MKEFRHGGDIYSREIALDFSASINPLGLPEEVKRVLTEQTDRFTRYPDPHCSALRSAIAAREHCAPEEILCGNGAADLIDRAVRVIRPKRTVVAVPTFTEYERTLREAGSEVVPYALREETDFSLDEGILACIDGADMVCLCSPNNPVGNLIDERLLQRILRRCEECGTVLLLDECFLGFVKDAPPLRSPNVLVLRAFTKLYAMAGLRLGYTICADRDLLGRMASCGAWWSVSVPAQLAGEAALKETAYVAETRRLIAAQREMLGEALSCFGWKVYPSQANYLLFRCPMPLDEMLLQDRIAIRRCDDFTGLDKHFFRIAVRTEPENAALLAAIGRCVAHG